jgi:hypothetical protein
LSAARKPFSVESIYYSQGEIFMSGKSIGGIVAGVVAFACLALLFVGGVVTYMYRDDIQAVTGTKQSQKTAQLLPEKTQFYMAFTPNLQAIPGYENLKTLYLDNPDILEIIKDREKEMSDKADINFKEDISPWMGTEAVIASPDFSNSIGQGPNPPSPDFVVSIQSRDKAASDKFIDKVINIPDEPSFADEDYQGITLHVQKIKDRSYDEVIITNINDLVVMSNDKDLVKGMIDKSKGTDVPSLVDNPNYKRIVTELPSNGISITYLEMTGILDTLFEESDIQLPTEQIQNLKAFEAMAVIGLLQPQGIQLDMAVTFDVNKLSDDIKESLNQTPSPHEVLNKVPADTLAVISSSDLKKVWEQSRKSLEANPDFTEGLADFEEETGLNVDDIFAWMTGEYAVVVVEVEPQDEFMPPVGGYLLIGTDDIEGAKSTVESTLEVFQEQSGGVVEFEENEIAGVKVNSAIDFMGKPTGGYYGFYENYFLAGYPENTVEILSSASQGSLVGDENFKIVQSHLPASTPGYLYVNLEKIRGITEEQMSPGDAKDYDKEVRPFLEPIQALGVAGDTKGLDQGMSKASWFLLIADSKEE